MKINRRIASKQSLITHIAILLSHAVPGDHKTRLVYHQIGRKIASSIWDRFADEKHFLKLKHLVWYTTERLAERPDACEAEFNCVCLIAHKLQRLEFWWPHLSAKLNKVRLAQGLSSIPKPSFRRERLVPANRKPTNSNTDTVPPLSNETVAILSSIALTLKAFGQTST